MPNICTTNYVIEGKKEELDALYQKMKELQEMEKPLVENNLGPTWLGCLVKALGKNPEDVLCRGIWIELERQDGKLLMAFETAWTPCYEVTRLMKTVYPSLQFFYKTEEPGCELYLKNDAEGKYFPEAEANGHPFDLMTEESEQVQVRLIRAIKDGKLRLEIMK
jgi:hypothetical protein